eukprot:2523150-Rhodomonas_salina.1
MHVVPRQCMGNTTCNTFSVSSPTPRGSHLITVPSAGSESASESSTFRATRFPMYLLPDVYPSTCSPAHPATRD